MNGVGIHGGFDDVLWLEEIKLRLDGCVSDRNGCLGKPYGSETDDLGQWLIDRDEYPAMVCWIHVQSWPIDMHARTAAALDLAIRSFIAAQTAPPNARLRRRVQYAHFPEHRETISNGSTSDFRPDPHSIHHRPG